jgi:hypothetical protein
MVLHAFGATLTLERRPTMSKDKSKGGKEVRKPKKAKPSAKPSSLTEHVPGKNVTQQQQSH